MAGITANAAGFSVAAAPAAGTPITLASTTAPAPLAGQIHNNAVPVQITSGGSGTFPANNITVVGTDRRGNPQTEIIPAPTAITSTTSGHLLFNTISSATPSATGTGTLSLGWAGINYGPWIVSAFHLAAVVAKQLVGSTAGDFDVATTTYDLLDPTVFLPQGQGGTPSGDLNQDGAFGVTNSGQGDGPFTANTPWPLVPAALQAACPQLLSTVNCLPEDDGTYSGMIIAPATFTAAAVPAAGGQTGSQARLDPTGAFAWRMVINHATPVVALDINVIRAALS
jgi:hypothetical protein